MDNTENTPATTDKTTELQHQVDSLRQLVGSVLVIVFILAGALNIYFWRQLRAVNSELTPLKKQSAEITAEMNKVNNAANEFARRLVEYGKTHPDFVPVLNKYGLREVPTTGAAPAKATAPAPAPAKK